MHRFAWAVVGLVAVLPLIAAPVPKNGPAAPPPLYFPTKVGAKWVYDGGPYPVEEVTAVQRREKEGTWIVRVTLFDAKGKEGPVQDWEVSAQGLFSIYRRGTRDERRQCFLQLPHKEGDKWQLIPESEFKCVPLKPRRVKVPAGEFEAVGVEMWLGEIVIATRWYAPGVGLVKIDDDKKTLTELKSFTPGKD